MSSKNWAICLFRAWALASHGSSRTGENPAGRAARRNDVADFQPDSIHARPDADGHHRDGNPFSKQPMASVSLNSQRAPFLPISCSPTRSTVPHPKRRPRCSRPCRKDTSLLPVTPSTLILRFSYWPPRTPSNRKEPTLCPKRNSTASCS